MSDAPQVFKAISAVQADLCKIGISKDNKNKQQGFMFRGIDQLYGALSPCLARHGLIITPSVKDRTSVKVTTKSGGSMSHHIVTVEYTLHGPDGSNIVCTTLGEAMDSGDKGIAKSLTAAYKYMMLQIFCVPIEGQSQDADSDSHEIAKPDPNQRVNELQGQQLKAALEASRSDVRAFLGYFKADSVESMLASDFERASVLLKKKMAEMPENLL